MRGNTVRKNIFHGYSRSRKHPVDDGPRRKATKEVEDAGIGPTSPARAECLVCIGLPGSQTRTFVACMIANITAFPGEYAWAPAWSMVQPGVLQVRKGYTRVCRR